MEFPGLWLAVGTWHAREGGAERVGSRLYVHNAHLAVLNRRVPTVADVQGVKEASRADKEVRARPLPACLPAWRIDARKAQVPGKSACPLLASSSLILLANAGTACCA